LIVSATLNTIGTFGCVRPNCENGNAVVAEPVTVPPSNFASTCHVVGFVTPRTVRSPTTWNVLLPVVGSGDVRPVSTLGESSTVG
jgi:hypothetical protein